MPFGIKADPSTQRIDKDPNMREEISENPQIGARKAGKNVLRTRTFKPRTMPSSDRMSNRGRR